MSEKSPLQKAGEKITGFFKGEKKEPSTVEPEGMKNVEDEAKKGLNKVKATAEEVATGIEKTSADVTAKVRETVAKASESV
jgi:hypothetical protein